jgi:hypothetical protein
MEDKGKKKEKAETDSDIFEEAIQAINDAQEEAVVLGMADSPTLPPSLGLSKDAVAAMAHQNSNIKKSNISPPRSPMTRLSPLGPGAKSPPNDKLLAMPMLGLNPNSTGMSTTSINSWIGGGGVGGNLRPAVGERGASKRHNRMVSWGIDGAPPNLAKASSTATGGDLSLFSADRRPSKISLQSVLNTSPYESEAVRYLWVSGSVKLYRKLTPALLFSCVRATPL